MGVTLILCLIPLVQSQFSAIIISVCSFWFRPRYLCRYSDSLGAQRSWDRVPMGSEIFDTRPDRPWGSTSLLYNGYWMFPWDNAAGTWRWQPTPSNAEVKEGVDLYLYSFSGPSWPVIGWPLHVFFLVGFHLSWSGQRERIGSFATKLNCLYSLLLTLRFFS